MPRRIRELQNNQSTLGVARDNSSLDGVIDRNSPLLLARFTATMDVRRETPRRAPSSVQQENEMKRVRTTAVLIAIATPALAQSYPDVNVYAYETGYTRAQASREIHHPAQSMRTANRSAYYGAYAFSPSYYSNYADNPWSSSRSLNHGQGPGCIQSPASLEYTGCD